MTAVILLVLNASIVLSVFVIGLRATIAHATSLFRRPDQLLRAFVSMNVLMPLAALAIGAPFDLHPAVKIALIVIAVSPTPPIFPKKALKAGGTETYTIGLLTAIAGLSVVVIPLSMEILAAITGVSLVMPARSVAVLVLTTILAPLVAGIAVRRFATTAADRAAGPIGVLATVLLIASAVPIVIGVSQTVWSLVTDGTILGLLGFATAGFLIGHVLGGPEPANRPVLGLATATRHPAVALAIAHANFPEQGLASAAVFLYVILAGVLSALYLAWVNRTRSGARVFVLSSVCIAALTPKVAYGQEAPPATAQPSQSPAPDFFHQDELTGDWAGARTNAKNKGFELASSLTQFYQGVSSGGTGTSSEYNGTAQGLLKFDLGKLAGWEYWSAEVKTEVRFGGPLITSTGTISPVNTAAIIPGADGTVFSVTAVNVTKLFPINLKEGKLFALSFGRYNLIDVLDEDFFAGGGTERFFNLAQIGPLTVLRQVPLVTNAVNLVYIRGGEPFITLALMDPNDHSTDPGLSDLFADGVTFVPGINFPVKYLGKTATHSFGGAITTKAYTPFDAIHQAIIPGPPINPVEPQRGSWSVNYVFRQYLVERAARDGWGFFGQVSFADQATSPVTTFFDVGLGGNGLIPNRPRDEFGLSYAYTDLSEVLKDNLDLLPTAGRLQVEHQLEMFYNLHLTPWLQLTADLQVLRPNRPVADPAVVPAVRLRLVF